MERFDCYLALGDSMSIDLYPSMDDRFQVKLEQPVGAASLFFRNDSKLWPEFDKQDLDTMFPRIYYSHHAFDGATTQDMLSATRISELEPFKTARVIVTVTIGGNDLLEAVKKLESGKTAFETAYNAVESRYEKVMVILQRSLHNALILITTVYDPTDGSGIIPGDTTHGKLPIQYLDRFNKYVCSFEKKFKNVMVCDVHDHFKGHGAKAGNEMWYWVPSPIEPGARGASELRRVWMSSLLQYRELA